MNERMGIKEAIEYLYGNFSYEELLDDWCHIAVSVVADIFGKDPEYIKNKLVKLHKEY